MNNQTNKQTNTQMNNIVESLEFQGIPSKFEKDNLSALESV